MWLAGSDLLMLALLPVQIENNQNQKTHAMHTASSAFMGRGPIVIHLGVKDNYRMLHHSGGNQIRSSLQTGGRAIPMIEDQFKYSP